MLEKPEIEAKRLARQAYYEKVTEKLDKSLLQKREDRGKAQEQQSVLELEAERLAKLVADESNSVSVTGECNKQMNDARMALKGGTPDINAILSKFDQIKQRLIQAYDSREIKQKWFIRVFITIVIFFIAVGFVIGWYKLIPGQDRLQNTAWVCLACALWGCIGSTLDAFVAMYKHFGKQDFDKHYLPWYFIHPFLGIAIGAVVYLVVQAGLLSIGGVSLQETSANTTSVNLSGAVTDNLTNILSGGGPTGKIGVTALPIALAFLGGFRQSTVMNFLTRLVNAFFPQSEND
jgi:hypothetical protein